MAFKPSRAFMEAREIVSHLESVAVLPLQILFESYRTLSPSKLQQAEENYSFEIQGKIFKNSKENLHEITLES
jgi:hypothetical protein